MPEIKTKNATVPSIYHPHGDWMECVSTGGIVYVSIFGPRRALKAAVEELEKEVPDA